MRWCDWRWCDRVPGARQAVRVGHDRGDGVLRCQRRLRLARAFHRGRPMGTRAAIRVATHPLGGQRLRASLGRRHLARCPDRWGAPHALLHQREGGASPILRLLCCAGGRAIVPPLLRARARPGGPIRWGVDGLEVHQLEVQSTAEQAHPQLVLEQIQAGPARPAPCRSGH